jgi:hypothetical protein
MDMHLESKLILNYELPHRSNGCIFFNFVCNDVVGRSATKGFSGFWSGFSTYAHSRIFIGMGRYGFCSLLYISTFEVFIQKSHEVSFNTTPVIHMYTLQFMYIFCILYP